MKRLLLLSAILFSLLLTFSQTSSKDLREMRRIEIKKVEKEYAPKNGVTNDPKMKEQKLASIDSVYLPRISEAEAREQNYQSQSANTQSTSQQTNQTPLRRNGGTFTFVGNRGTFYGSSRSLTVAANSYATLVYAEATAEMMTSRAKIVPSTNGQYGFLGTIENIDRHRPVEIRIKSITIGNNFNQKYTLAPGQRKEELLPPGDYIAEIIMEGYSKPRIEKFNVSIANIHYFYGKEVYFYVFGGEKNN